MSKTFRVNPETFEETQERNYLKRKKKEDAQRRKFYADIPHDHSDDCDEDLSNESAD